MDAWALRSHARAVRAIDEGRFTEEIVPLKVQRADGAEVLFDTDEHPAGRHDGEAGRAQAAEAEIPGFSITAGKLPPGSTTARRWHGICLGAGGRRAPTLTS